MKADELRKIDFKSKLQNCYEDIQPYLEKELNKLRAKFIELPDTATESDKLACVQVCVESLNALDENEDVQSGIDKSEREVLCDSIYQMGTTVGLDAESNYVDAWRDW